MSTCDLSTHSRRFKKQGMQALGRACSGRGSKIHMIVDTRGNPLTFSFTAANTAVASAAKPLIEQAPHLRHALPIKGMTQMPWTPDSLNTAYKHLFRLEKTDAL